AGRPDPRGRGQRRPPLLPRRRRPGRRRAAAQRVVLPDEASAAAGSGQPGARRRRAVPARRAGRVGPPMPVECRPGTAAVAALVIGATIVLALRGVARPEGRETGGRDARDALT